MLTPSPEQVEILFKLVDQVLMDDPEHWGTDQRGAEALRRELGHARELSPGWTAEDEVREKNRL